MASILIVEDDPIVRLATRLLLETDGHVVAECPNGLAVDSLFAAAAYDLVIVDILMPGKDGIETIVSLRRSGRAVKIIAISGHNAADRLNFLDMARSLGADATLQKPFDGETLRATIQSVLKTA